MTSRFHIRFSISLFFSASLLGVAYGQDFAATELLGRPTDQSVTLNMVPDVDLDACLEYTTASGDYSAQTQTDTVSALAGDALVIEIDGLASNTRYYYRVKYSTDGWQSSSTRVERTFHTRRPPGSSFRFLVQTDPHRPPPGYPFRFGNDATYEVALANEEADGADFLIDMGDTFIGDAAGSEAEADSLHYYQRRFFDQVAHSTPLFLSPGNHEGETGWFNDGTASNEAVWATNARKKYYPNPSPNGFYSGDASVTPFINGDGRREAYYAWEWGDALFVVIDPYWFSVGGLASGEWDWSLGEEQYSWFKQTVESSNAAYKFVFGHQLFSIGSGGRGGANRADTGEWGAGEAAFQANRPTWTDHIAIHDLMVANDVSAFFHGHDHFFGLEYLDGVVYQECPMPATMANGATGEYPNTVATISSGGHLRLTVSPTQTLVEYVSSTVGGSIGDPIYSYTILPSTPTGLPETSTPVVRSRLEQNAPNPFGPATSIEFNLVHAGFAEVAVYEPSGRLVSRLLSKPLHAGRHFVHWNGQNDRGRSVSPGRYFYQLRVDGRVMETRKAIVLK